MFFVLFVFLFLFFLGGRVGAGRAHKAIPNSFSHLLHSPKTLIKLNDIDSVIKMHCSPSCLHNQIMIICVANVTIWANV